MHGDGIVMTPLFKKYMELGQSRLEQATMYRVLEYIPKKVFQWFIENVTDTWRMADIDPAYKMRQQKPKVMQQSE